MAKLYIAALLFLISFVAYAERDPTMPQGRFYMQGEALVVEEGPTSEPTAKLVLVGGERKLALVSGKIVGIGDAFDGGKILDINENGVEVQKEDGEIVFLPVQSEQKSESWKFLKVYRE